MRSVWKEVSSILIVWGMHCWLRGKSGRFWVENKWEWIEVLKKF